MAEREAANPGGLAFPAADGVLIDGRRLEPAGRAPMRSPASGERFPDAPVASPAQVEAALAGARAAQPAWEAEGLRGRLAILAHLRECVYRATDLLADHVVAEVGKPRIEALYEVMTVLECFEHVLEAAPRLLAEAPVRLPQLHLWTKSSSLIYQPWGVVGLVMPWNFPLAIPGGEIVQALVGGNTVVLKPSEFTPFTALALGSLLADSGLPRGVLQVVPGGPETGAALVGGAIDKLSFVGSVATGRKVEAAARARGVAVTLELGGKDPALVAPDAALPHAARGVVWGAMMNAGQGCSSVERAFVHTRIHDAFVAEAVRAAEAIVLGNGQDPASWMGPLIHKSQLAKVEAQVADARARGATVVTGGRVREDLGPLFYAPTVLTGVTPDMQVMKEETFGPLLPIRRVESMDQAVAEANACPYKLGASVWTADAASGEKLARRLVAGTVWINDVLFSHASPQAPWGGPGDSGDGRTHGEAGILGYVRPVFLSRDARTDGIRDAWYPYGPERLAFTRAALDLVHGRGLVTRLRGLPRVLKGLTR